MSNSDESRAVVEGLWAALGRRDYAGVGAFMSERGHYVDVPVIDVDEGAFGPAETESRLRLGLEPLASYVLHDGTYTVQGHSVITEHSETWNWVTGETALLRFASVMEVRDGKVDRWWDYFDLGVLMNAAPASWVEHVAHGYK